MTIAHRVLPQRARRNWAGDFPLMARDGATERREHHPGRRGGLFLEDGRPDFHALRSLHACQDARLIAYNLLGVNGENLRKMPLHERRRRLETLLAGNDVVRFSGHVEGTKGAALFRRACAMGLEGIVSKRIDTAYRSGPFLGWRKIKCRGYARQ
jgi:ATP-dependent DNA ligase